MSKLKLTLLQQDVLNFLFLYPEKTFTGRSISTSLDVSQAGISKALKGLSKQDLIILNKDKVSKRLIIKLNIGNNLVLGLKRANNLKNIYETGFGHFLEDQFPGATIILFGSYSWGDDISISDIDIAIIGKKETELDLSAFEKILKRKIILQFYSDLPSIHKNLRENICNGIVLTGSVEF